MVTGEEIKNARRKIGKTQEQLAEEIDISSRGISRFENDKIRNLLYSLKQKQIIETDSTNQQKSNWILKK